MTFFQMQLDYLTFLQSENKLETLESNKDSLTLEAVPLLAYFIYSSPQDVQDFAISRLKVIVNDATPVISAFPKATNPFSEDDKGEDKEIRCFWKQPQLNDIQGMPLVDLSLHLFLFSFDGFNEKVQSESFNVIKLLFQNEKFVPSTRIMLDVLLILPLFLLRADAHKDAGFSLLKIINEKAEQSCDTRVLVATKSLLLMFNHKLDC